MKRLLLVFLCLILLCGCAAPPAPTEPSEAPTIATEPAPPTEPAGLYDPAHALETVSGGAVKVYPIGRSDTQSVAFLGDDILIFNTWDTTTLTLLRGENLYPAATAELSCSFDPADASVQVSEKGVTYFDYNTFDLVFLDAALREIDRIAAPAGFQGTPALSADRKTFYYTTESALRALDLESGIDRLLKEMWFSYQSITALHCDDTVIECGVSDEDGGWRQLYLSTETGELLYESLNFATVYTRGMRYFTTRLDGSYTELLTGTAGSEVRMLLSPDLSPGAFPVLAQDSVITLAQSEGSVTLDYYRLDQGIRPYCLTLPEAYAPWCIQAQAGTDEVWFLSYDAEAESDLLCRWELPKSAVEDDTVYIGLRRTADEPDTYGLEMCAQYADQISEKHGIQVLTWTEVLETEPWDYHFEAEYQVSVLYNALFTLDSALSAFPEGFFAKVTEEMGDGVLRIGLARNIIGNEDNGALDFADGLQFWDDNFNAFITLKIGDYLCQNLFHEMFHVAESRIYSHSSAFDNWDDLNPTGFSYDYDYTYYTAREDYDLISDENRAFIDFYSMTYPKEDRARIMEYATMYDTAGYFANDTMQAKLRALCIGIREAYDLEAVTYPFLWEQYLNEPIHAIG